MSDVSTTQADEIRDRVATADEYEAAFQRYRKCLIAAGHDLQDVEFKDHLYEFGVPNAAVEDGTDTKCYRAEFYYTDVLRQGSEVATAPS